MNASAENFGAGRAAVDSAVDSAREPSRERAERELALAGTLNPGPWTEHSRFCALACEKIAEKIPSLDADRAYVFGLLHDIGRRGGIFQERHLIEGWRYCMQFGWTKLAQICISHAFMIRDIAAGVGKLDVSAEDVAFLKAFLERAEYDDYDRLVQLCDGLALPRGFCFLETRIIDVALRYGVPAPSLARWRRLFEIKERFEAEIGSSIYELLPGEKFPLATHFLGGNGAAGAPR